MKSKKIVILENGIYVKSRNIEKIARNTKGFVFAPLKTIFDFPKFDMRKKSKNSRLP